MKMDSIEIVTIDTDEFPSEVVTNASVHVSNGEIVLRLEKTKIDWSKITFIKAAMSTEAKEKE